MSRSCSIPGCKNKYKASGFCKKHESEHYRRKSGANPRGQEPPMKNNKTGFRGVYFEAATGQYRAFIYVTPRYVALGRFSTPEDAAQAYDDAVYIYFPDKPHFKNTFLLANW